MDWTDFGLTLLGMALVGLGCWWIYPPASLIVIGGLLIVLTVASRVRR